MTERRYTKACIEALRWFEWHEPVGLFGATAPTKAMRDSMERRGLIMRVPMPERSVGLIKYQRTPKGRNALRDHEAREARIHGR